MTSEAVWFLPCGPVPTWFVNGVARALDAPCPCVLPPDVREGHAPGCPRGEAWDGVMSRAASAGVNGRLTS